jgi:amino acid transporter
MKNLIQFIVLISSIISPLYPLMIVTGILILTDTAIGVYAAFKAKEAISSRRFGNVISKMVLYQISLISGFLVETYVLDNIIPMTRVIAGVITFTELFSILENVSKITNSPIGEKIKKILNRKAKESDIF